MFTREAKLPVHHYKKSDEKTSDQWKPVRNLRNLKKSTLLLVCLIFGLAYWHLFHATSALIDTAQQDEVQAGRQVKRSSYAALHDRLRKKLNQQDSIDQVTIDQAPDDHGQMSQENHDTTFEIDAAIIEDSSQDKLETDEDTFTSGQTVPKVRSSGENDEDIELSNWEKGPAKVEADLNPAQVEEPVLLAPNAADKQKVIETEPNEHLMLEETAENLPEIIHIPFEEAVKDYNLAGWEDEWISKGQFDGGKWTLKEPKIDFVYLWVNGSDEAFQKTKRPYEENSVLNDADGVWISSHGVNRYRDWDELRYAVRSVEKHARSFRNQIQIIVNSVRGTGAGKQIPTWLNNNPSTQARVKVISQEEFMDKNSQACLPTFNSLTIENQLFNTHSDTDFMFALSDDMLLGKRHAASDIVSPLLGPVLGFKTNQYNTVHPPTEEDSRRFGEKPFLIYSSWLLNRRFGQRKRKGQGHFGHALSRDIMREAIGTFPGPELESACKRFRGEPGFQLYSWFITFHYLIERHREAMLWSLIMLKTDTDGDGYLSWEERQQLIKSLGEGMKNEGRTAFRKRIYYHVRRFLEMAGLEAPQVNTDFLWTSLDGPTSLINLHCSEFEINECLAPGFSISMDRYRGKNPAFSAAVIFERVARQRVDCGDCLLKLVLNQVKQGLEPVLPDKGSKPFERELAVKALMRYKYTVVEPNGLFMMLTDAEQIDKMLVERYVRNKASVPGQLCLNDDITTTEADEYLDIQQAMHEFYEGLFPEKSEFEL